MLQNDGNNIHIQLFTLECLHNMTLNVCLIISCLLNLSFKIHIYIYIYTMFLKYSILVVKYSKKQTDLILSHMTCPHYKNMPMQHTAFFHGCKNDNFQLKCFDYFHIFAQNINCGYTLEPPH